MTITETRTLVRDIERRFEANLPLLHDETSFLLWLAYLGLARLEDCKRQVERNEQTWAVKPRDYADDFDAPEVG